VNIACRVLQPLIERLFIRSGGRISASTVEQVRMQGAFAKPRVGLFMRAEQIVGSTPSS
jgi:hypothetical protein